MHRCTEGGGDDIRSRTSGADDENASSVPLKIHPTILCTAAPRIASHALDLLREAEGDARWCAAAIANWGAEAPPDWSYGACLRLRGFTQLMSWPGSRDPKLQKLRQLLALLLVLRSLLERNLEAYCDMCSRELLIRTQARLEVMRYFVIGEPLAQHLRCPCPTSVMRHVVHDMCDRIERRLYAGAGPADGPSAWGSHDTSRIPLQAPVHA